MDKLLLTVVEAAAALNLSRGKVYELLYKGSIASAKIGGCRRIPAAALRAYVDSLTDPGRVA